MGSEKRFLEAFGGRVVRVEPIHPIEVAQSLGDEERKRFMINC